MTDWQVKIYDAPETARTGIYIYRKMVNHTEVLAADGTLILVREDDVLPGATLQIPGGFLIGNNANDILRALAEAISEKNIAPREERFAGELEATKRHLSDFQKLVFEKRVR